MPRHTLESLTALGAVIDPASLRAAKSLPRPLDIAGDVPEGSLASETGRAAQKLGDDFEAMLERTHELWRLAGKADIGRLPVDTGPAPYRIQDPTGKIRPGQIRVLKSRQGFDYQGVLEGGRAIAVEAKASASRKTSLGIGPGGPIRAHQLERLADGWLRFGRLAAIVWLNGTERLVLTPDAVVRAQRLYAAGERKSVPVRDWTPYKVVEGIEGYLAPLLEGI